MSELSAKFNTIGNLVKLQADRYRDKPFIIVPGESRTVTYHQLGVCTDRMENSLRQQGIGRGDKVSILLPNVPEYACALLGIMKLGAVANPLNIQLKPGELQYLLEHAESKLVVTSSNFLPVIQEVWRRWGKTLPIIDDGCEVLYFNQITKSTSLANSEVSAEDVAELIYTTGTTGKSKGVLISQNNILFGAQSIVAGHRLTENDRGLCLLPFFHVNAQMVNIFSCLLSGGSIILPARFSAEAFWPTLSNYQATWFNAVPTIYAILLNRPPQEAENLSLSRVQFGRSASAFLPILVKKTFEQRFNIPLIETYGITETTSQVTTNPREMNERKIGSVGREQGCQVRIVNREGQNLPNGHEGEIVVKGRNVMKGYYKDHEATTKVIRDGWFHSGDLGYKDDQGYLFITGRLKDTIIRGGENIQPREIDELLFGHPKIQDAATLGVTDPIYGEEVKSFVVISPGQECSEAELLDYCRQRLADFKCPKSISFLREIPKSPGGKIMKRRLVDKDN